MADYAATEYGLFPACAGVIPINEGELVPIYTFPRMCGGDPGCPDSLHPTSLFSPHVRG